MINERASQVRIQHLFCNIITSLNPSLTKSTPNCCIVYLSVNRRGSDTEVSLNYTQLTAAEAKNAAGMGAVVAVAPMADAGRGNAWRSFG